MTVRRDQSVLCQVNRWLEGRDAEAVADRELLDHYLQERDSAAFAVLMRRHGPMVLGVARRLLRDAHAAEDVFQATFLVLARRGASIRGAGVGAWLHGVAWNLAAKARQRQARATTGAVPEVATAAPGPMEQLSVGEAQALLDEELRGLPERCRAPLVLCYLQGRTRDEAAKQLGWPVRRLKLRLEQGRTLLRDRLLRRGVELTAVVGLVELSRGPVAAALVETTAAAVVGRTPVPAGVAELLREALPAALPRRLLAAALLLVGVLVGAGVALVTAEEPPAPPIAQAAEPPAPPAPPPAPTDRDGDPLPAGVAARLGTTRLRTGDFINSAALSPDGRTLAATGNHGVDLIDPTTGHARPLLRGAFSNYRVRFAPDSQQLFISDGRGLALWDVGTGKEVTRYLGNDPLGAEPPKPPPAKPTAVGASALTRDGKTLAAAVTEGGDPRVRLWDVATGRPVADWASAGMVHDLCFAPDGRALASIEVDQGDPIVRLRAPLTGAVQRKLSAPATCFGPLAFAPDGSRLAAGGHVSDNVQHRSAVVWWEVATGKLEADIRGTPTGDSFGVVIRDVQFTPDGKTVAWSGWDCLIHLADVATGKEVRQFRPDVHSAVNSLAFTADGSRLYGAGGGSIRVWNMAQGTEEQRWAGHVTALERVAWRDARSVVTYASDQTCRLWDATTGKELGRTGVLKSRVIGAAAFSPDGRRVTTAHHLDSELLVWDVPEGKNHFTIKFPADDQARGRPAFSPDGRLLAASVAGAVGFWDAATGKEIKRLPIAVAPGGGGILWSPDSRCVTLPTTEQTITTLDVESGATVASLATKQFPWVLALAPDGRMLAEAGRDNVIRIWEVATGQIRARKTVEKPDFPYQIAWSPDSRTLAWVGTTPDIELWDVTGAQPAQKLKGHRGRVFSLAFSPTGDRLLSGSEDTTALVWNLPTRAATPPVRLTDAEANDLWNQLTAADAVKAFAAITRLAAASEDAAALLRKRITPAQAPDPKQVARWIAELDASDFETRRRADEELERLSERVEQPLREALAKKPSLEMQQRLEVLLRKLADTRVEGELLRNLRGIEALERSNTPAARATLAEIARGAAGARLTRAATAALERLK